jgi:hypothetical protein
MRLFRAYGTSCHRGVHGSCHCHPRVVSRVSGVAGSVNVTMIDSRRRNQFPNHNATRLSAVFFGILVQYLSRSVVRTTAVRGQLCCYPRLGFQCRDLNLQFRSARQLEVRYPSEKGDPKFAPLLWLSLAIGQRRHRRKRHSSDTRLGSTTKSKCNPTEQQRCSRSRWKERDCARATFDK